jgi:hypothetical protein
VHTKQVLSVSNTTALISSVNPGKCGVPTDANADFMHTREPPREEADEPPLISIETMHSIGRIETIDRKIERIFPRYDPCNPESIEKFFD